MTSREGDIAAFLSQAGWQSAGRATLAGDASNRQYDRVNLPGRTTVVLMDAPREKGEDIQPFLLIADHLTKAGLSAPKIIASDPETGLILMEDLGDDLYFSVVENQPDCELELYRAALDALHHLHQTPPPAGVPKYQATEMADAATLASIWYDPEVSTSELKAEVLDRLTMVDWANPVLVLRDYHAQNLIWLPDRPAPENVGQLDFQDAALGHPLYDAVSLINDARRELQGATRDQLIADLAAKAENTDQFHFDFAMLSAQRNLRILGVFARLCMRDGKVEYVDLIPRVWRNLLRDLTHPELSGLNQLVSKFSEPSAEFMAGLRLRCAK